MTRIEKLQVKYNKLKAKREDLITEIDRIEKEITVLGFYLEDVNFK